MTVRRANWPMALFLIVTTLAWVAFFNEQYVAYTIWKIKLLHIAVFLPWTISVKQIWRKTILKKRNFSIEVGMPIAAAFVAEGIQAFTPSHTPDLPGLFASLLGVALATIGG